MYTDNSETNLKTKHIELAESRQGIQQLTTLIYMVSYISKKIKRNIVALSKIRHFVNLGILKSLYYALIFPFLTYCLIALGNTYSSTLLSLFNLQKKVVTYYNEHTNYIFIQTIMNIQTLYSI